MTLCGCDDVDADDETEEDATDEATEVIEGGPEFVTAGVAADNAAADADWNEAFRLTFGDGRSLPASLELVVCPDDPRDSTDHEDISRDLGLLVFILTRRSSVDTRYGIVDSSGSDFRRSSPCLTSSPESQS